MLITLIYLPNNETLVLQTSCEYASLKQQLATAAFDIPNKTHPQTVCTRLCRISVYFYVVSSNVTISSCSYKTVWYICFRYWCCCVACVILFPIIVTLFLVANVGLRELWFSVACGLVKVKVKVVDLYSASSWESHL